MNIRRHIKGAWIISGAMETNQMDQVLINKRLLSPINRLTPNDPYTGRTAPLTSKRCTSYIYSTNIGTEYFKHALYSPFFFLFKMKFV